MDGVGVDSTKTPNDKSRGGLLKDLIILSAVSKKWLVGSCDTNHWITVTGNDTSCIDDSSTRGVTMDSLVTELSMELGQDRNEEPTRRPPYTTSVDVS